MDIDQWLKEDYVAGSQKPLTPEDEEPKDKVGIAAKIRVWFTNLLIKAIQTCSTEQDRVDVIAWLALAREILGNKSIPVQIKAHDIFCLIDSKKAVGMVFRSVGEAVKNYKKSDLPLPVKVALPSTLIAAGFVGGQGAGLAAFGGAIGLPVLLLFFLGTAGITSVIETFLTKPESRDYINVVMALIIRDEVLRRAKKEMREAMTSNPCGPIRFEMPEEEKALRERLVHMDPYDFENHVMSFFQAKGLLAWTTRKSNDLGVDGFARHPEGLIIVQCKRNAPDNPVGRPTIQQFKGVIEEHEAYRGYVVTTSHFTIGSLESSSKNKKLFLIDMEELIRWHADGISLN